jgi:transcription elongation GreA/GreB family factor
VNDWQLLEFEISYLEKYRIDTAIQRVQAFIALHPEHKLAKLRLSLIGLGINRLDLVDGSLQSIPSTTDLPIDYVIPAIQVMKYGGNPNEAVDFAYHFLRENFNELQAHQALIVSMLPGPATPDIPPTLAVVGSNAAVCYQEFPQGIETWVVLEDTEKPNGDFEEISLTSPLAGELLNKRVGDTVVIARGTLQDRTATIVRIVPKYVRRYQDSTGEMQVRFGPASTVESIRIPTDLEKNPEEGLKVILESVEKRAAALADARSIYSSLPASLHWYGTCFGKNAYVALMDLAREEGQQIKCSFGTAEEREPAVKALQTAKVVIIDITALATLRLLGLEHILSCSRFRFVISERTWVAFQEMLFNDRIFSAPGGTLMYRDGQHFMLQESAEEKEQRNQNNEEFIRFLEKTVEIRSAPALAALEHEKRESLRKFFGPYGAESILLASDPESILWTDDLIQAQMSAQEFGVRRVWSQLVLGFLTDSGLLTPRDYSEATANLVGMEFVATLFDSSSTLAAVRLAEWSFKRRPAAQFLKIFADPAADLQRLLRIFVEFTINLYREPVTPETRDSLTRTLLDTFAMRSESMVLLSSFRKVSSRIFGINQVGKAQFEECYDNWLTRRDKPIIYLR